MKKSSEVLAYIILVVLILGLIIEYYWVILIILGIYLTSKIIINIRKDKQLKRRKEQIINSGIYEIDKMSGYKFENFLVCLFEKLEYSILKYPQKTNDFGADLVIENKKGIKIAVQAKRYKNNVSLGAVQEARGAMGYYNCKKGLVVTNSYLTTSAKKLALKNNISIWEREDLIEIINSSKSRIFEAEETNKTKITNPNYFKFDEETRTITDYNGESKEVVIPSKIDSLKVEKIGHWAFNCSKLESVEMPDGIVKIGTSAFGNNNLDSVKIPDSVEVISDRAFKNNELTEIVVPNNVELKVPFGVDLMGEETKFKNVYVDEHGRAAGTYILKDGEWKLQ